MPETVNMVTPEGATVAVPLDQMSYAKRRGYVEESASGMGSRLGQEAVAERNRDRGVLGDVAAGALGLARGASFGLSDVIAPDLGIDRETIRELKEQNPTISGLAEAGGAIGGALLSGGSSLVGQTARALPSGFAAAKAGQISARLAQGGGTARYIGGAAAGGAFEAALQNTGAYLSDVALDNKDLSAEGLVGSFAQGGLFGGVAGGGLAAVERGLVSASSLFPRRVLQDRQATELAEERFAKQADDIVKDGDALEEVARGKIINMRQAKAEIDLRTQEELARIKTSAEQAKADQRLATQKALDELRIERARAIKAGTRPPVREIPSLDPTYENLGDGVVVTATIPPEKLANRIELPGVGSDAVKTQKARDIVAREPLSTDVDQPIRLAVHPDGRYEVIDGRHRIMAAIEQGKPIRAEVERAYVPDKDIIGVGAQTIANVDNVVHAASVDAGVVARTADGSADEIAAAVEDYAARKQAVKDWVAKHRNEVTPGTPIDSFISKGYGGKSEWTGGVALFPEGKSKAADKFLLKMLEGKHPKGFGRLWDQHYLARTGGEFDEAATLLARDARAYAKRSLGDIDAAELAKIDAAVETLTGGKVLADLDRPLAERILDEAAAARRQARIVELEERVAAGTAVGRDIEELATYRPGRLVDDATEAIKVLGDFEKAEANLVAKLGPEAPPAAVARAAQYTAKVDDHARKVTEAAAQAVNDAPPPRPVESIGARAAMTPKERMAAARSRIDDIRASEAEARATALERQSAEKARATQTAQAADTVSLPAPPAVAAGQQGLLGRAADIGAVGELLSMAGVDVPGLPDLKSLPVVGPLLGVYLKIRGAKAVLGRLGGKVPATAETTVARRGAAIRDRAALAVDRMLGYTSEGLRKGRDAAVLAAPKAGEVLRHSIFPAYDANKRRDRESDIEALRARVDEVMLASSNPDAVRARVRSSLRLSDPDLVNAIAEATVRQLSYLAKHAPKVPPRVGLSSRQWTPSKAEIEQFARRVRAATDPASVLEDLENGTVTREAAETLREVYPALFAEVQAHLLERATSMQTEVPYFRRIQLSLLFDVPLDPSMRPATIAALQSVSEPIADAPPAPQGTPPTPAIAAPVDLASALQPPQTRLAAMH